jgi:hypothetical protein
MTCIEFHGDTLIVKDDSDNNAPIVKVQLTPLTDTETGAIVWRDGIVVGGLYRSAID